jgi:hypothetical protein
MSKPLNSFRPTVLKKGLKKFGEHGKTAATSKMKQLHERAVFEPIHVEEMTQVERR